MKVTQWGQINAIILWLFEGYTWGNWVWTKTVAQSCTLPRCGETGWREESPDPHSSPTLIHFWVHVGGTCGRVGLQRRGGPRNAKGGGGYGSGVGERGKSNAGKWRPCDRKGTSSLMIMVMMIVMIMKLLISVSLDGQCVESWEGKETCFVFVKNWQILNIFCTVTQLCNIVLTWHQYNLILLIQLLMIFIFVSWHHGAESFLRS